MMIAFSSKHHFSTDIAGTYMQTEGRRSLNQNVLISQLSGNVILNQTTSSSSNQSANSLESWTNYTTIKPTCRVCHIIINTIIVIRINPITYSVIWIMSLMSSSNKIFTMPRMEQKVWSLCGKNDFGVKWKTQGENLSTPFFPVPSPLTWASRRGQ